MVAQLSRIWFWRVLLSVGVVAVAMVPRSSAWIRYFPVRRRTNLYHPTTRLFGGISNEWYGTMTPFSEYAMHVLVDHKDAPITVQDAIRLSMGAKVANGNSSHVPEREDTLTPQQLLQLGSIWYLPKAQHEHNQLGVMNSSYKPQRLSFHNNNSTLMLQEGDYLRIHHTPRRFPSVYQFDWKDVGNRDSSTTISGTNSIVITHSCQDYWIINKPPLIPVHATVDNAVENVVHQLATANPDTDYVVTTQRIDINTSGLLVVAKSSEFAAYFAQLLRHKTKQKQQQHQQQQREEKEANIIKRYKCLVCLQPGNESVVQTWQRLQSLTNHTIKHFLEPSDRAPKRFELEPPSEEIKQWLECLLRITDVSPIYPIPNEHHLLATRLWTSGKMPTSTKGVCEVSIQLETGRTHQIRGQLSRLGYPLVGDEQYGGAIPSQSSSDNHDPQLLALQSSYIGFWDPDYTAVWSQRRRTNVTQGVPSNRWVEASLERAWWTSILEHHESIDNSMTSSTDVELLQNMWTGKSTYTAETVQCEKAELLPPPVQLSPGRNKYVLVKAESQSGTEYWFVKSASPAECGGPYHANVAEELVEWIQAAGFERVTVTGGGRIDYDPSTKRAHVYGFSYGFGKGDHAKASDMISQVGILGTFDSSNALY